MTQKQSIVNCNSIHSVSDCILSWSKVASYVLILFLLPCTVNAQFIKIDIDIPAKTGVSEMEASEQNWQPDANQTQLELDGTFGLTISSVENLQVFASLKHSDYLINASGTGVKLSAVLAYRNDGKSKPPKANATDRAQFPMSNSGFLIEYMKDSPQVLNAYLMVYTTIERPKVSGTTYVGDIHLTIEYN